MSKKWYAAKSPEVSEREKSNYTLARKAAAEGFVLLENNGVLPLPACKIALYGMGARKTIKGGTGSGAVNERYSVPIEKGLENGGYTVTSKSWLDDYDFEYDEKYHAWEAEIAKKTAGMAPHEIFAAAKGDPFRFPAGRLVNDEDVRASDTDTAIYVIARQAGESHDRRLEPGDWYLTDVERENLLKLAVAYTKTVLVINVGGPIELSILDEVDGIDAVVFYGQGGMEGGNAFADVLSGKTDFSGRLTSTWALKYEDYPNASTYGHVNGDLDNESYLEGIYVGYRYFDSYAVKPRYPFGYGLSYTKFSLACSDFALQGTRVQAKVQVMNTGATNVGRQVVQLYLSCPVGRLEKEKKRLVAFAKTRELVPKASEELVLEFDMTSAASYDEAVLAWVLEKGAYLLQMGVDAANTEIVAALEMDETVTCEQCVACCAPKQRVDELPLPLPTAYTSLPEGLRRLTIDTKSFSPVTHDYGEPRVVESKREKTLLDTLAPQEMAELLCGGGVLKQGQHNVTGAGGKTTIDLANKGIGNIVLSDGPAGLNIINEITMDENGFERAVNIPEKYKAYAAAAKNMIGEGGEPAYRYATAWPVHLVLAQSWNTELLHQVGEAVGREMLEFGITIWLAPGMNINRNPLCGRNFEYFSEDPLLSGKMAAAITKGVQSHQGVGVSLKHFACNNQEDNRTQCSSNINERALREIYLKGFQIAVTESQPWTVMSSYNKINHIYTANNYDLCTKLLRCEWNFGGLVMTDWGGRADPVLCAGAGNDLVMPGNDEVRQQIAAAVSSGTIDDVTLRRSAARVLHIVLKSDIYQQ